MPLYDYRCPECGTTFEAQRSVAERYNAECECGGTGNQVILRAAILDPRLGVSKDFPTLARKWDRSVRRRALGLERDSANNQLTGNHDYEREAHRKRKEYDS